LSGRSSRVRAHPIDPLLSFATPARVSGMQREEPFAAGRPTPSKRRQADFRFGHHRGHERQLYEVQPTSGCDWAVSLLRRLLPCRANSRYRPQAVRRISPKLPDAQPRLFAFRIYEAAVGDLQQPARCRPSRSRAERRELLRVVGHLPGARAVATICTALRAGVAQASREETAANATAAVQCAMVIRVVASRCGTCWLRAERACAAQQRTRQWLANIWCRASYVVGWHSAVWVRERGQPSAGGRRLGGGLDR
jgi:hypothetical protein